MKRPVCPGPGQISSDTDSNTSDISTQRLYLIIVC